MPVKKLSFKGDTGKRKRTTADPSTSSPYDPPLNPPTQHLEDVQDNEETWTTAAQAADLNGPLVVSLTYDTDLPVALSADARGSIFTSPLPSTLEPSEVRQVFVLAQIPTGTSNTSEKQYSLKSGGCAKYLGADRFGSMTCDSDAIAEAHRWRLVQRPDGWALQSSYDRYLSIQPRKSKKQKSEHVLGRDELEDVQGGFEIRCDAEDIGFCETLTLRTQPQHRLIQSAATSKNSVTKYTTKIELEKKVGRKLQVDELQTLKQAEKIGELGEAILDMRVKGRSDKFG